MTDKQPQPKPFDPNANPDAWRDPNAVYPQPQPQPKAWYKSKTLWLNMGVAAVGLATSAQPQIEGMVSAEIFGLITAGIGFANAALRFATKKPIGKGSQ